MRILVTGGAGFIGSHVVDGFVAAGHDVTVLDDLSTGSKKNLNPKAIFSAMDCRDPNLATLFEKSKFDVVNHHGAQIDVRRSVQDPFFDASVNVLGTLRVLDCCRSYGVKRFIYASSGGTIYGECGKMPAKESDPVKPASPYGFSKACAETYVQFYGKQFNISYAVLRYANVYGPRQDPRSEAGVVAIFLGKALNKSRVTVYGDGHQERDYVHVSDVVQANLKALDAKKDVITNVGTGLATSVLSLYKRICDISGCRPDAFDLAPPRVGELQRSVLDPRQAAELLGWRPKESLLSGLESTLKYLEKTVVPPSK